VLVKDSVAQRHLVDMNSFLDTEFRLDVSLSIRNELPGSLR
jgi:hypothetical protein